jgi:hypothetical protein
MKKKAIWGLLFFGLQRPDIQDITMTFGKEYVVDAEERTKSRPLSLPLNLRFSASLPVLFALPCLYPNQP